jgi:transglycosylase-like protein with SLT domain
MLVVVLAGGLTQPVRADDLSARQETVKQQLAAASAKLNELNSRMAALEQTMTDTQQRIGLERAQVKRLARTLYAQPDSLLGALFDSASLSDALTRIGDLTSAAERAAATRRALDRDLSSLSQQRVSLQSDRDRQQELKKQLEEQFAKLVAQAAASIRTSAPPPSAPAPAPGIVGGSASAIQQIILDAFAPLGSAVQQWALRVAKCESNYNPYAVNRSSGASGLFQFLAPTWAGTPQRAQSVFDPVANAQAAAWLYQRYGPSQWSCK